MGQVGTGFAWKLYTCCAAATLVSGTRLAPGLHPGTPTGVKVFVFPLWPACHFQNCKLQHCWRYGVNSDLGKMLTVFSVSPNLKDLFDTRVKLLQNNDVRIEDATMLCCTNKIAQEIALKALRKLFGPEFAYFAVDRHGASAYYNTEADETNSANSKTGSVNNSAGRPNLTDENDNPRSLFDSLAQAAVVRLWVGAKVLATTRLHHKVRTGSIGTVLSFADPEYAVDAGDNYGYGCKVDET